jgi:hypothetical protein
MKDKMKKSNTYSFGVLEINRKPLEEAIFKETMTEIVPEPIRKCKCTKLGNMTYLPTHPCYASICALAGPVSHSCPSFLRCILIVQRGFTMEFHL